MSTQGKDPKRFNPFVDKSDSRNIRDSTLPFCDSLDLSKDGSDDSFQWSIDDIAEFYPVGIEELPDQEGSASDISISAFHDLPDEEYRNKQKYLCKSPKRALERRMFEMNMLQHISPVGKPEQSVGIREREEKHGKKPKALFQARESAQLQDGFNLDSKGILFSFSDEENEYDSDAVHSDYDVFFDPKINSQIGVELKGGHGDMVNSSMCKRSVHKGTCLAGMSPIKKVEFDTSFSESSSDESMEAIEMKHVPIKLLSVRKEKLDSDSLDSEKFISESDRNIAHLRVRVQNLKSFLETENRPRRSHSVPPMRRATLHCHTTNGNDTEGAHSAISRQALSVRKSGVQCLSAKLGARLSTPPNLSRNFVEKFDIRNRSYDSTYFSVSSRGGNVNRATSMLGQIPGAVGGVSDVNCEKIGKESIQNLKRLKGSGNTGKGSRRPFFEQIKIKSEYDKVDYSMSDLTQRLSVSKIKITPNATSISSSQSMGLGVTGNSAAAAKVRRLSVPRSRNYDGSPALDTTMFNTSLRPESEVLVRSFDFASNKSPSKRKIVGTSNVYKTLSPSSRKDFKDRYILL
eukprot:Nk52_evm45s1020 gene=Nk52_evmTU45s1020